MKKIKTLVLYSSDSKNQSFSYQIGWPLEFNNHNSFDCNLFNISSYRYRDKLKTLLSIKFKNMDCILIMHSIFSNTNKLQKGWLHKALIETQIPKIYFIGNEYKLMPEKLAFSKNMNISMLISQSNSKEIHQIYENTLNCKVIGIPNTGLNTNIFAPIKEKHKRSIDIGYRATSGPFYLGHQERTSIADYFSSNKHKHNLQLDISNDNSKRFSLKQWAEFLNNCKAQIGSEAGTDYFELSDKTRLAINKYTNNNPAATFEEVHGKYFKNYGPKTPNRMISGRNIEAAGTKTLQILFEGEYGGYLKPDVHYISLKKDFSNFDETIAKFSDDNYSNQIIENAYDLVHSELTYNKLLNILHKELLNIIK